MIVIITGIIGAFIVCSIISKLDGLNDTQDESND